MICANEIPWKVVQERDGALPAGRISQYSFNNKRVIFNTGIGRIRITTRMEVTT